MATTFATIRGFRILVKMAAYAVSEYMIVSFEHADEESEACSIAVAAARHAYPMGTIDAVSIESGRWCPTGLAANAEQTAVWAA